MINIKDFQPKKDGMYLAYIANSIDPECEGHFQVLSCCDGHWNAHREGDGTIDTDYEISGVTHWDYLPAIPKEEEA